MVNQRFTFAVHIMTALAFRGERMDSQALALSVNTNPVVVRRLLLALRRAHLVNTSAGRSGGATLAKPANRITLLQIYDAIEPRPVICLSQRKAWRRCPVSCNIKGPMMSLAAKVEHAVRGKLRAISLDQVVRELDFK